MATAIFLLFLLFAVLGSGSDWRFPKLPSIRDFGVSANFEVFAEFSSSSSPSRSEVEVVGNADSGFWLFDPDEGFDLTHPSSPTAPPIAPRFKMETATAPITIAPSKTALIIIDMQNFFLSSSLHRSRGPGHDAEDRLLSHAIPAARKAGIQVVHVTWGISEEELSALPPIIFRAFSFYEEESSLDGPGSAVVLGRSSTGVGDDMADVELADGSVVPAGRMLIRDQWNTALHEPLEKAFNESQSTDLPDMRFHKSRLSGFWGGGSAPVIQHLRQKGITTLMFAGVNTDQCVFASLQDAANIGFDAILLTDVCGTNSPDYAREMVEFNCKQSWGFLSTSVALSEGVSHIRT